MDKSHYFWWIIIQHYVKTHTTSCRALSSRFCSVNKFNDINSPLLPDVVWCYGMRFITGGNSIALLCLAASADCRYMHDWQRNFRIAYFQHVMYYFGSPTYSASIWYLLFSSTRLEMRQWPGCTLCWLVKCSGNYAHPRRADVMCIGADIYTRVVIHASDSHLRPCIQGFNNVYSYFNLRAQGAGSDREIVFSRLRWARIPPGGNPYRKRISSEKPFTWYSSESIHCEFSMTSPVGYNK